MTSPRSEIDSELYVKLAPGHEATKHKTGVPLAVKLKRSTYDLAQSPVLQDITIDAALLGIAFKSIFSDPCVYTYGGGRTFTIPTLYVDDIPVTGRSGEWSSS